MPGTRMETEKVGVARSTVGTYRVRVHKRASVGATIARHAYRPALYLCMRINAARLFGAEIVLDNRPAACARTSAFLHSHLGVRTLAVCGQSDGPRFDVQTFYYSMSFTSGGRSTTAADAPIPLQFRDDAFACTYELHKF
ncbi:hypothetical protein EVAR_46501_1 [Eumeta japonica]|uniref:Uncharacterized protein n=1 Tax=Eumeta variegata TaxID=151549 RepID=A0A4C1WVP7_EUMVA|nr:hypothetical protein EVAR_46501_1 [Eumeta japonica]